MFKSAQNPSAAVTPQAENPKVGPVKATLFIGVFLVFSVVLSFGLLFTSELVLRLVVGPTDTVIAREVTLFPYRPYYETTQPSNLVLGNSDSPLEMFFLHDECDEDGGVTARFNSHGFRGPEMTGLPPKDPGEVRVVITGGSVSMSWQVGEKCTLDANLRRLFAEHYPERKVRIFNLGSGAWKSFQQLIALQLHAADLEPDIIISLDGFNDIQHSFRMDVHHPYSFYNEFAFERYRRWVDGDPRELFATMHILRVAKDWLNDQLSNPDGALADAGLRRAAQTALAALPSPIVPAHAAPLQTVVEGPVHAAAPEPGRLGTRLALPLDLEAIAARTDFDPYNRLVVDTYLRNQRLIAVTAATMDAEVLTVLQPTLYLKRVFSPREEANITREYAPAVNFVVQGYERMRVGMEHLATDVGNLKFLYLGDLFAGEPDRYFRDNCHVYADGYRVIADRIFEVLRQNIS